MGSASTRVPRYSSPAQAVEWLLTNTRAKHEPKADSITIKGLSLRTLGALDYLKKHTRLVFVWDGKAQVIGVSRFLRPVEVVEEAA